MAAEIVEQSELEGVTAEVADFTDPTEMSQEEITAELEGPDTTQALDSQPEELPDKYQGKSVQELARMHQEAEKLIGKHSSEVGELRKTVDQFILSNLQSQQQETHEPEPEPDFFEDPDTAVNRAIERHPAVQQAKQTASQYKQHTAMASLQNRHPDMGNILADPKFIEWSQATPVRQRLFQEADKNYNAAVADELLTLYKEHKGVAQEAAQVEQQARQKQVRAAQTGGAQGTGNSGGSKRVYRRADIIKLMKTDPDRYEALSPEIMQAYSEGRVR